MAKRIDRHERGPCPHGTCAHSAAVHVVIERKPPLVTYGACAVCESQKRNGERVRNRELVEVLLA